MKRFADGPDIISRFLRENAWVSGCSTSDSPFQHNACEVWLKQMHVASRWYLGTCNAHILLLLSYIPVRLILAPREIKPKLAQLGGHGAEQNPPRKWWYLRYRWWSLRRAPRKGSKKAILWQPLLKRIPKPPWNRGKGN